MKEITNPGIKLVVLAISFFMTSVILFGSLFAVTATNFNGEPNSLLSRIVAWAFVATAIGQLIATMVSFGPTRQKLFKVAATILLVELLGVSVVVLVNT